jgi:hypothetical protein
MVPIGESFETNSGPDDGALASVATTFGHNRVSASRTLPGMVMSASETRAMLFRQRVKTVTHVIEFLTFVQNCSRRHDVPDFLRA